MVCLPHTSTTPTYTIGPHFLSSIVLLVKYPCTNKYKFAERWNHYDVCVLLTISRGNCVKCDQSRSTQEDGACCGWRHKISNRQTHNLASPKTSATALKRRGLYCDHKIYNTRIQSYPILVENRCHNKYGFSQSKDTKRTHRRFTFPTRGWRNALSWSTPRATLNSELACWKSQLAGWLARTETAGAKENDGAATHVVSSSPRRPPESETVPVGQEESWGREAFARSRNPALPCDNDDYRPLPNWRIYFYYHQASHYIANDQIPEVPTHCRNLPCQQKEWSNPISALLFATFLMVKTMIIATKRSSKTHKPRNVFSWSLLCNDCLDLLLYPASAQSKEKKGIFENLKILHGLTLLFKLPHLERWRLSANSSALASSPLFTLC